MSTEESVGSVQILSKGKLGLSLNKNALKEVFSHAVDLPVHIVSICGDSGNGKTFLLNMYMRHLKENSSKQKASHLKNGKMENVFKMNDWTSKGLDGIWISNEPQLVWKGKRQVALYVMDTTGINSCRMTKAEETKLFQVVQSMSSCIIFNVMKQINSNNIDRLMFPGPVTDGDNKNSKSLVKKLLLLIRDFPHPENGYGLEVGCNYMTKYFAGGTGPEVGGNYQILEKVYGSVEAFAMPRPSEKMFDRKQDSKSLKVEVGENFMKYANELFRILDDSTKLTIASEAWKTGKEMLEHVLEIENDMLGIELQHTKTDPEVVFQKSPVNCNDTIDFYEKEMEQNLKDFFGESADLQKIHVKVLQRALEHWDSTHSLEEESNLTPTAREQVKNSIQQKFEVISRSYKVLDEERERTVQLCSKIEVHIAEVRQRVLDRSLEPREADALTERVDSLKSKLLAVQDDQEHESAKAKQLIRQKNVALANIRQELEEQQRILSADGQH